MINIATFLVSEADINSLILAHPQFYALLNDTLYVRNATFSESSALLWAASHGKLETTKRATRASTKLAGAALTVSLENRHESVAKLLLLIDGIDTEVRNRYNKTPLCLAAEKGYLAVVQLLVAKGASLGLQDD